MLSVALSFEKRLNVKYQAGESNAVLVLIGCSYMFRSPGGCRSAATLCATVPETTKSTIWLLTMTNGGRARQLGPLSTVRRDRSHTYATCFCPIEYGKQRFIRPNATMV